MSATPQACPSANDPCGNAQAFSFTGLGNAPEFWVNNAGTLALTGRGSDYRIHTPDEGELPSATTIDRFDVVEELIGVRAHDDLRPLLRALTLNPPARVGVPDPTSCPLGELHPLDAELTDPRTLGNRCVTHYRNEWWSSAEAACRHGLARVSDDEVAGALLYNLALIARERGAADYARSLLEQSLTVRPGNKTTKAKLREFEREER